MRIAATIMIAAALLGAASGAWADEAPVEPTLDNAAPVVVKTEPQAGASGVAAGPAEITVTFSKPMQAGGWSWMKVTEASFPPMRGQPSYSADQKSCTLPVTLAAGKTYAILLGSSGSQNFTDQKGRRALPYLLVFSTK